MKNENIQIEKLHKPTKRVLDILEILSKTDKGMTLTEISKAISSPKSTIHPIIQTMVMQNFVYLDDLTKKYFIGINTFCIGVSYTNNSDILELLKKEMKKIVDEVGEICQLGILDGGKVLYIAKVDADKPIRIISHVGKKLPAYCTALGKAMLCRKTFEELREIYPKELIKYTPNTISTLEDLYAELQEVKKTNIAYEHSEITEDSECIAIPLEISGEIVAALSISIPNFRMSEEKISRVKKILLENKEKLEILLSKKIENRRTNIF